MTEDTVRTIQEELFPSLFPDNPNWAKLPAPFKSRYGYREDETGRL